MSLNEELKKLEEDVLSSLHPDVRKLLVSENAKLFSNFMESKAIKIGTSVPDVFFRDKDLKSVFLNDMLNEHHLVLNFFRGTWCPYCNLELTTLAKIHHEIEARGAKIISVSPELHQFSKDFIKEKNIPYDMYTDLGNKAATEFGLAFNLPPKFREIYRNLNVYLNKLNGDDKWSLPMPATFIISKDRIITSAYINADYTKRMEPDDILHQLDLLQN